MEAAASKQFWKGNGLVLIDVKKILLLTDGWRRFIVSAWETGILRYFKEHKEFSLTEYHCWGNWSHDKSFNRGEYAIFDLPDYRQYDGIIADLTNVGDAGVREKISEKIRSSGVPSVTLCDREEGIICVRSDNYQAVCTLFDHLWDHHGCRTFFFVGSSERDSESAERKKAFADSCIRHGLKVTPDMVMEHDFDAETGVLAAKQFFRETVSTISHDGNGRPDSPVRPLPDAFVCANDNIAVGLIMEMRKHGYECPRDFKVTGFDNLDKAMYYQPQITTATLNREGIAYHAMETLDQMIQGKPVPPIVHTPVELVYAESCGCPTCHQLDLRAYLAWQVEDGIFVNHKNEQFSTMASDLDPSLPLEKLMERVMERYAALDTDGVYIVLDSRIGSGSLEEGYDDRDPSRFYVAAACERKNGGGMRPLLFRDIIGLKKHLSPLREESSVIVLPLHIRNLSAGYIVFYNPRFLVREWRFYEFQDIVLHALSEWDANRRLMNSLEKLREVYYKDLLTGVYSKTAIEPILLPWMSGQMEAGRRMTIVFIDIDGFKQINDSRGHAYGDYVLQNAAACIRSGLPESSFCYRYGGDEFVAIVSYTEKDSIPAFLDGIREGLREHHIMASVGLSDFTFDSSGRLEDCLLRAVHIADQAMYREKRAHHAARAETIL